MINAISPTQPEPQKKYKDPLNKTAVVLLSYSNELGAAIGEIAPKLGSALWIPTFMYLGADIYDKYKNDKDSYNPSAKRAFKRAVYQGMTSLVALPLVIMAGQYAVSPLGRFDKSGISGNAKDAIFKHTKDVISQIHNDAFTSYENFEGIILRTLENKINSRRNEKRTSNIFKKMYKTIFTRRYDLLAGDKEKVIAFAKNNAQKTFELAFALQNGDKTKIPKPIYNKYMEVLPIMKEMYKNDNYSFQAIRTALKKYQIDNIFKNKIFKTLGGLSALLIFAKPVNDYVEKRIMNQYINPSIDKLSNEIINKSIVKSNKLYSLVNDNKTATLTFESSQIH